MSTRHFNLPPPVLYGRPLLRASGNLRRTLDRIVLRHQIGGRPSVARPIDVMALIPKLIGHLAPNVSIVQKSLDVAIS